MFPQSLPKKTPPVLLFMVIFFIGVAADGDDADCRAGCVRDDDGLSRNVVLVLVVTGGAGCLLCLVGAPASATTRL